MFKPPRSHFDSVTQRLVLNMDHFCPWVVNCVGCAPAPARGSHQPPSGG